jgi:SAM-dependent methyltransferase
MAMSSEEAEHARLMGLMLGHQATEIAAIGVRSGLFAAVAARPGCSAADLAAAHDLADRYVATWARGAYAHGFLDLIADGGYELAAHMERLLLDQASPSYLGGRFRMASAMDDDYRRYPELLRTGETWPRSEHGDEVLAALADSTAPDASVIVDHALPNLPAIGERLAAGGSVLDIGSGGAFLAIRLAKAFPSATVHAIESDAPSLALARRRVTEHGVASRVHLRELDAVNLDDEACHDLVTMNLVLHEVGDESRQHDVLRRAHRALRPGGGIVVSELPYPDDESSYRSDPVHRRLAGIMLHEAVVGCGAITTQQLLDRLAHAGFVDVRPIEQPRPSRYVVVATRPR